MKKQATHLHPGRPGYRRAPSRGVSMVELLVGITVSMLTVLAITQVFLASEEQRRVPASMATTQINGIQALDAIQRDIQQAGYGLGGGDWLGCETGTSTIASSKGLSSLTLAPVRIETGSAAEPSDSITILYSGKVGPAMPIEAIEAHDDSITEPFFTVTSNLGLRRKDWFVAVTSDGGTCDAFQVLVPGDDPANPIVNPFAVAANNWTVRHRPAQRPDRVGIGHPGQFPSRTVLTNLGENPVYRRWSVADLDQQFSLQMTDLATAMPTSGARPAEDAYPDIVLMRAFYGKDTNADGVIDTYDTAAPTGGAWSQVLGVRLAIVARSPVRVKGSEITDEVTPGPLVWNLGNATVAGSRTCVPADNEGDADSRCLDLALTHTVPGGSSDEWKFYRYRLFDTMVPMRNLIWNAGSS